MKTQEKIKKKTNFENHEKTMKKPSTARNHQKNHSCQKSTNFQLIRLEVAREYFWKNKSCPTGGQALQKITSLYKIFFFPKMKK